jgi:co-chaperonin GroES (HSP10)
MNKIFPMFEQILLAEDRPTGVTASGIVVEGNLGNTPTYTVVAVGSDVKKIAVGNKAYVKFGAESFIVKVDGVQRVLVPESSIVAVVGKHV